MLTQYLTDTKNLLQNPTASIQLYDNTSLTRWINIARGQIAGESESIRFFGTISTVINQRNYNFSAVNTGTPATSGIQGIINVRSISYGVGENTYGLIGRQWIPPRSIEWFTLYNLNNPVPDVGPPSTWCQFGQGAAGTGTGSAATGSFIIDPPPDAVYLLLLDCTCYPIALTDDATIEAIPYLWTDAVPFFAAYYAYLSSQTGARQADAERMYNHYQTFMQRARQAANPSVNRTSYEQSGDPTQVAKLGVKPQQGAA